MADLAAVTAADVSPVQIWEQWTVPAAVAITAGQLVGIDVNGQAVLADADTGPIVTKGIALHSVGIAGQSVTAMRRGIVAVGAVLDGMAFNAAVFVSATPGLMADAVVNAQPAIGEVVPGWKTVAAETLLRIDC